MAAPIHISRKASALLTAMLLLASTAALAAQDYQDQNAGDPPSRVARIAYAQGNVSLEPAGVDNFSAAELNYPLTAGDRIYADPSSLAELQTGGLAVRLGNGADLTLTSLTDNVAQFGLAQGSIRVRTRDLQAPDGSQAVVEIDTPNGTILVQQPGDLRVDSYPQDDTTVVTISSGQAEVSGQGFDQVIGGGQSIRLSGSNPVYAEFVGLLPPDNLDQFDSSREQERQQSIAYRNQYVDPDMIGAGDLDQYGDWQPATQFGPVWFPRGVAYDWTPYSVGHWAWVTPWGWTWVDAEPWGFAPFHYGRWNNFNGRWGWVPGPPPSVFRQPGFGGRPPRPVYSPALVAFVGGPNFSISVGFGGGSGLGVTAWFPLGPSEAYTPWYHTSPAYVNRVNVTNIYSTNVTQIHNTYINRTTNIYNTTNVTNITYVNRNVGTVAVAQKDFAAGKTIAQSQTIKLDPATRQKLAQAPILPHPLVTPTRAIAAPQAPARALPPTTARPVVETREGFQRAGAPPSATPLRAPTPQPAASGAQAPVVRNAPVERPAQQPAQPVNRAAFPQQRTPQVIAPAQTQNANAPRTPVTTPQSTMRPAINAPFKPTEPAATEKPATAQPAPVVQGRPAPRPVDQPRALQTVTPPQPAPPTFEQQRKAIEQTDPGRPLGPKQLDNLRQGKPAGPATQPEPAAHPAPAKPKTPPPAKDNKDEKPK